jgi:hypothetical protein
MRHITLPTAAFILFVAPFATAKPLTVRGAKCTECHIGAKLDKQFNEATQRMIKMYQEYECKKCHGSADGKLTILDKEKK